MFRINRIGPLANCRRLNLLDNIVLNIAVPSSSVREWTIIMQHKRRSTYLNHAAEDFFEITTLLHRNNSQMILLIHPDEERLCVVVVDAASSRPEAARVSSLQESVKGAHQSVSSAAH